MKIKCACDNLIIDQTDYLSNKGYLISDLDWFNFWDSIDEAIESTDKTPKEREAMCMQLRKQRIFKTLWECDRCGNLFVNGDDGNLVIYIPDNKNYNQVLNKPSK